MPSVNIYTSKNRVEFLSKILPDLRQYTARELSCGDRELNPNEMSLRILVPGASLQIADTELEIKVYSYPERIKRQDEICRSINDYVSQKCPEAGSVYTWLQLSELGHSAEE